jgi:integrase
MLGSEAGRSFREEVSDEQEKAHAGADHHATWRFGVALVLANETGHRIGAVRRLRWSDIDFENVLITWRAESEKSGWVPRRGLVAVF